MAEKRKLRQSLSSKSRRSGAQTYRLVPAKRKATTPAEESPKPSTPVQEPLPTKVKDADQLPTLSKAQSLQLSLRDYQSYGESAVAAAALQRSQAKWLQDCIFEKYWTKPSRKKGQPPPVNPPKDSMTKLGPCTIVIEPHRFEVMLYTVRNQHASSTYTPQPRKPQVHVQYTAPSSSNAFHQYQPHPLPLPPQQIQPVPPNSHAPPTYNPQPPLLISPSITPAPTRINQTPQHTSGLAPLPNPPEPLPAPALAQPHSSSGEPSGPPQHNIPPEPTRSPQPPPEKSTEPSPQPSKSNPDPVIQMLATRAAVNPELKALMKVVASSSASQEQLRAFQAHIDELNAIIASRKQQESRVQSPQTNSPYSNSSPAPPGPPRSMPAPPPVARPPPKPIAFQPPPPPPSNHHLYAPPPQHIPQNSYPPAPQIRSKFPHYPPPPPPPPYIHQQRQHPHLLPTKPDIKGVVFEFVTPQAPGLSASGDRYLLPENMIIDYIPPGTQVIASFLVVKKVGPSGRPLDELDLLTSKAKAKKTKAANTSSKGQASSKEDQAATNQEPPQPAASTDEKPPVSTKPDDNTSQLPEPKEYYQPITMRLLAHNPRTLEPLSRVVKPLQEVQRHMNDVMDRIERAPICYLAMRLPRDKPGKHLQDDEAANGKEVSRNGTGNKNASRDKRENRWTRDASDIGVDDSDTVPEEEDVVLQDFYDFPSSIVPLK